MSTPSFSELTNLVAAKQQEVESLQKEFKEVKGRLDSIGARLEILLGTDKQMEEEQTEQPKKSLKAFVRDILAANSNPMTIKEIAEQVLANGYKTLSRGNNFSSMVQQAIYHESDIKRLKNARPAQYQMK